MGFADIETDSLKIKLKHFKATQEAARDLMRQDYEQQAISTYVKLSALILEIEIEIATRQRHYSNLQ